MPLETVPAETLTHRQIQRVRHELKRRDLTVWAVNPLGPHMRRIHFRSSDLHDFTSLSPDDHMRLFLPAQDGGEPESRDYTPRRFDVAAGELVIDFALHEAGPATAWAINAKPGDKLVVGGPRGSAIIPSDFDWYVLIGDKTALPAIGRWLEEAKPGLKIFTLGCIDAADDIQTIDTRADWTGLWLQRDVLGQDDAANVRSALKEHWPKGGDGFVWIAAEAQVSKTLRAHVNETLGHPLQAIKASGYWVREGAQPSGQAEG